MVLRLGSKGQQVVKLQEYLGLKMDGDFGPLTELKVKEWQRKNNLKPDGIVGPKTWDVMSLATTDMSEIFEPTNISIAPYFLPPGEFKRGPTTKDYLFLHHTAGWEDPFNQVDQWARDNRGSVATEFVIGGQSVRGNVGRNDGVIVHAIPPGGYGWHLGTNGSQYMHEHSVAIEVCNFGWLKDGRTYAGTIVDKSQMEVLNQPFRGFNVYHKYSEAQLKSLYNLIIFVANRDNIDIRKGLIEGIKNIGPKAFEFNENAYYGRVKGMWTHTNTRKDKSDLSPQPNLIDMLLSI